MTGIDTNVLIRYLVRDDPEQARKAGQFISRECTADNPALINRIVLCEMIWVLESAYGYSREKVALALGKILRAAQFRVEDHQEAWISYRQYQAGADFADSLIAAINRKWNCDHTVTFDRKAARHPGFVLL
jgi:predicted nucleic-acid-binding protein